MKNYTIKNATACYTGGGIYLYWGQFTNGLYFLSNNDCESVAICTEDTSTDDALYQEFLDAYMVEELTGATGREMQLEILNHILTNKPDGNYLSYDIEMSRNDLKEHMKELEGSYTMLRLTKEQIKAIRIVKGWTPDLRVRLTINKDSLWEWLYLNRYGIFGTDFSVRLDHAELMSDEESKLRNVISRAVKDIIR